MNKRADAGFLFLPYERSTSQICKHIRLLKILNGALKEFQIQIFQANFELQANDKFIYIVRLQKTLDGRLEYISTP